jgi:Domain of unknown function (DUF4359)
MVKFSQVSVGRVRVMESSWKREEGGLKPKQLWAGVAIAGFAGLGLCLAATNPSQAAYEAYATQRLSAYLQENVCSDAPAVFNLRKQCRSLVKSNQADIRRFVATNTHRQNFIFFSVYTTDLSVGSFLPSYQVKTVGMFQNFRIVHTESE